MGSDMRGLTQEEAEARLEQFGKNELTQKKKESMLKKLLANFTSLMALLLWAGGIMAILSGALELGISIFCVNLINGPFSFSQEFKAERATDALQKMLPSYARVIRDGEKRKYWQRRLFQGTSWFWKRVTASVPMPVSSKATIFAPTSPRSPVKATPSAKTGMR